MSPDLLEREMLRPGPLDSRTLDDQRIACLHQALQGRTPARITADSDTRSPGVENKAARGRVMSQGECVDQETASIDTGAFLDWKLLVDDLEGDLFPKG